MLMCFLEGALQVKLANMNRGSKSQASLTFAYTLPDLYRSFRAQVQPLQALSSHLARHGPVSRLIRWRVLANLATSTYQVGVHRFHCRLFDGLRVFRMLQACLLVHLAKLTGHLLEGIERGSMRLVRFGVPVHDSLLGPSCLIEAFAEVLDSFLCFIVVRCTDSLDVGS